MKSVSTVGEKEREREEREIQRDAPLYLYLGRVTLTFGNGWNTATLVIFQWWNPIMRTSEERERERERGRKGEKERGVREGERERERERESISTHNIAWFNLQAGSPG